MKPILLYKKLIFKGKRAFFLLLANETQQAKTYRSVPCTRNFVRLANWELRHRPGHPPAAPKLQPTSSLSSSSSCRISNHINGPSRSSSHPRGSTTPFRNTASVGL